MPITSSSVIRHTLVNVNVDMQDMKMTCVFNRDVDGVLDKTVTMIISGNDLQQLFATQATDGQPLNDEITVAIYQYAVSKGIILGVIS